MTAIAFPLESLDFEKNGGFVVVVTQDARSGAVLMVARADREAVELTIRTGEMHYHSRRRGPWQKGATSGNRQRVVALRADCDGDALLARVVPAGPSCHSGAWSCFNDHGAVLSQLDARIAARAGEPAGESPGSWTRQLLADRNLRLKKLGEEATELAIACADGDAPQATEEAADVFYHTLVALRAVGAGLEHVLDVLAARGAERTGPAPRTDA